ncbi:MAG: hypothetical protein IBX50_14540 [Marinospirillum sp.]|uniref:hypothetical protein n=1 Tax=Marinospirillum sp. TaxID=2183934 RepID=UPI001A03359B|nr:hypothetical protein [Marinospirillum sp.]MBE0507906.1 hypothetical protein [Marinospirillum sp.]
MATYSAAKMLTAYYERTAQSVASNGNCPRIVEFRFGHGYVDETTDPPTLLPIPSDLNTVPGEFYTGIPEVESSGGRVIVKCTLPPGGVTVPHKYSITTLHDDDGTILAAMQDLPDWITPTDEHVAYGYLDYPHLSENPPAAI